MLPFTTNTSQPPNIFRKERKQQINTIPVTLIQQHQLGDKYYKIVKIDGKELEPHLNTNSLIFFKEDQSYINILQQTIEQFVGKEHIKISIE